MKAWMRMAPIGIGRGGRTLTRGSALWRTGRALPKRNPFLCSRSPGKTPGLPCRRSPIGCFRKAVLPGQLRRPPISSRGSVPFHRRDCLRDQGWKGIDFLAGVVKIFKRDKLEDILAPKLLFLNP